jgi:hypothetical protein
MITNPVQFNFLKLAASCSSLAVSASNLGLSFDKEQSQENRIKLEQAFNTAYTEFLLLQVMLPGHFMVPDSTSVVFALEAYKKEVTLAQKSESFSITGGTILLEALKALKNVSQKVD